MQRSSGPSTGWRQWGMACMAAGILDLSGCGGGSDAQGVTPQPSSPPVDTPVTPTPTGPAIWGQLQGAALGEGASLNGAIPFPAGNAWNTDISVAPASDTLIASIGATRGLHPDFGAGLWDGAPISIPYVVVGATQPKHVRGRQRLQLVYLRRAR